MRVTDVMNSYSLYAGFLTASRHLMGEAVLGSRKQFSLEESTRQGIGKNLLQRIKDKYRDYLYSILIGENVHSSSVFKEEIITCEMDADSIVEKVYVDLLKED